MKRIIALVLLFAASAHSAPVTYYYTGLPLAGQASQMVTGSVTLAAPLPLNGTTVLPFDPISKHRESFQDLRARLGDRHLRCYLAQHRDLGRGVPDVVITRAQSARRHL